jgi:hypothetical protein
MEVPFLKPVATVLSHFNEEVPYKPNASIYKYRIFFSQKARKKVSNEHFCLAPAFFWRFYAFHALLHSFYFRSLFLLHCQEFFDGRRFPRFSKIF